MQARSLRVQATLLVKRPLLKKEIQPILICQNAGWNGLLRTSEGDKTGS